MKAALDLPSEYEEILKDGFWPSTSVVPSFEDEFIDTGNVCEEYDEDEHFVGQTCDHPTESFWINWDLYEGYFVTIRPSNNDVEHLVWIARALSDPNSNPKQPGCVLIQYFQSISCNKNIQKFHMNWDFGNGLQ